LPQVEASIDGKAFRLPQVEASIDVKAFRLPQVVMTYAGKAKNRLFYQHITFINT